MGGLSGAIITILVLMPMVGAGAATADDKGGSFLDDLGENSPFCYVSGNLVPVKKAPGATASPDANEALTGMIRLRFQAADLDTCKASIEAHCRFKWQPLGYAPDKVAGYFRKEPSSKTQEDFNVAADCTIFAPGSPPAKGATKTKSGTRPQ